nr:MAG: Protein of unknown function (DUF3199) [Bacteriophage sp.]
MIIDDSIKTQVGTDTYNRWKDAALADLSNMLCMNTLDMGMTGKTGVVGDDGTTLYFPSWYSEIWSIKTTDGTPLDYKIDDNEADGLNPSTKYANIATLTNAYPAGTQAIISGRHGFERLPKPLTSILAAIIQADQSMADQTDRITSKSIEDVSVTYTTSTQTTLEHALTPYLALLNQWSLCHATNNGGLLSMPTPHHDLPWWINTQDLRSNNHAIM